MKPLSRACRLLLILSLVLAGGAGAKSSETAAAPDVDPSAVTWQAAAGYRLTLSISGPEDFHHRQTFAAGVAPNFRIFTASGDYRAAGPYNWEIVAAPVTKAAARQNRSSEAAPAAQGFRRSGTFTIKGGAFLVPGGEEPAATAPAGARDDEAAALPFGAHKDFPINDDLLVQGGICIGLDCVDGEMFGRDNLRLKHNNLRIHFEDTSTTWGGYPTRDWRITVNDDAHGGADKFSIDDVTEGRTPFTIVGGARADSLFIGDGGRVGFGTSVPVVELHAVDSDTPTLRLEQVGSSAFTPQTWDVAGNEANFFIRDVDEWTLPFRILPGTADSLLVLAGDRVGIGTDVPAASLHLENTPGDDEDDVAVSAGGYVGIGTTTPEQTVHIRTTKQGSGFLLFEDGDRWQVGSGDGDTFVVDDGHSDPVELTIDQNGNMTIAGSLITGGGGACDPGPCDGTFIDYELESIEEHSEYMWQHSHLWGVGPTPEGAPIDLTRKTTGILHELEKAHIYIEQLNKRLKALEAQPAPLTECVTAGHPRRQSSDGSVNATGL